MNESKKRLVVIGAGPSGLAAAFFAQEIGYHVSIIEKENFVGGKGASFRENEYTLDFGPHTYHPRTKEINDLIIPHAGTGYFTTPVKMELILKNKRFKYPFSPLEGCMKFDASLTIQILFDYLIARISSVFVKSNESSFKAYGINRFGKTLYDLCFGHYTERVWGIPADNISVILAKKKLPKFSIRGLLQESLFGKSNMHSHIITQKVGYHRQGIGAVYESIANAVVSRGGDLILPAQIRSINIDPQGKVKDLTLIKDQKEETLKCDAIISTIPITSLVELVSPKFCLSAQVSDNVEYRDILLVFAHLDRPSLSDSHWTYFVDDCFKFQRISEQKNLTKENWPNNSTVITMEISCARSSEMWNWESEQFREIVLKDLNIFGVTSEELKKITVKKLVDAYPIYRSGYEKHLEDFFEELGKIPNLLTTGRQGLFLDIGMHDAMALGKRAVEHLANPKESNKAFYFRHSFIGQKER